MASNPLLAVPVQQGATPLVAFQQQSHWSSRILSVYGRVTDTDRIHGALETPKRLELGSAPLVFPRCPSLVLIVIVYVYYSLHWL